VTTSETDGSNKQAPGDSLELALEPLHPLEARIRDLIDHPRRRRQLRDRGARWYQLCSAMDVIGDTELAMQYACQGVPSTSPGAAYVVIYGVLQALYLQQDAATRIAKCLGLELELPPEIEEVRETRNAAGGHPSTYKGSGTGIVRYTASTAGFELNIWAQKGGLTRKHVSLRALCVRQAQALRLFFADVVKKLEEEDLEHKREYRDESLASLFSDGLSYPLEQLSKVARDEFGVWEFGCEAIAKRLVQLKEALEKRGYRFEDLASLQYYCTEVDFTLLRLRQYFEHQRPEMDSRDAAVYVGYLKARLADIETIAVEIDQEYSPGTD
jgi:hypothetical protein